MLYELVDMVGVHMKQRSKTEAPVCKLEVKIWVSSEGKNILSRSHIRLCTRAEVENMLPQMEPRYF